MVRIQVDQIRCDTTSNGGPEQTSIVIAADTPAVILFEASPVFTNGAIFNVGKVFEYNQQIRIHVIATRPAGNISFGPAVIYSQAPPGPELLTGLLPTTPGASGQHDLVYRILPQASTGSPLQFPISLPQIQHASGSTTATARAKISRQPTQGLVELYLDLKKTGIAGSGSGSAIVAFMDGSGNTLYTSPPVNLTVGATLAGVNEQQTQGEFSVPLSVLSALTPAHRPVLVVKAVDNIGVPSSIPDATNDRNQLAGLIQAGTAVVGSVVNLGGAVGGLF